MLKYMKILYTALHMVYQSLLTGHNMVVGKTYRVVIR